MRLRTALPPMLLVLLIALHVAVTYKVNMAQGGIQPASNHFSFLNVLAIRRVLSGYQPLHGDGTNPGRPGYFIGEPEPTSWSSPAVLWRELHEGRLRGVWKNQPGLCYWVERPICFSVGALFSFVGANSVLSVALSATAFLSLLLVAVYGIGRELQGPWTGLAAALICSGYPAIHNYALCVLDVIPLAASSTVLVYLILRTRGLSCLWPCILFGPCWWACSRMGESFTSFGTAALVSAGPFFVEVWHWLRAPKQLRGWLRGVMGILLMVVVPVLLTDWQWVAGARAQTAAGLDDSVMAAGSSLAQSGWLVELAYYVMMFDSLLRPLLFLLAVLALVVFALAVLAPDLLPHVPAKRRLSILLWWVLPLVVLHTMERQATWYLVPFLPALAVLTAVGLQGLPGRWARRLVTGLACLYGLFLLLVFPQVKPSFPPWVQNPARGIIWMRDVEVRSHEIPLNGRQSMALQELNIVLDALEPLEGQRALALLATDGRAAEAVRYIIELNHPRVHVYPLFSNALVEDGYGALGPADLDYLVYLTSDGFEPWKPMDKRQALSLLNWGDQPPPSEKAQRALVFLDQVQQQEMRPLERMGQVVYFFGSEPLPELPAVILPPKSGTPGPRHGMANQPYQGPPGDGHLVHKNR